MSDKKFDLTRRRVLGGMATIGAASAAAGAGTMALFSDSEGSTGNTIQAGTLDLTAGTTQAFSTNMQNIAPGDVTETLQITLSNVGSLSGNHVEITAGYGNNDGSEPADGDLQARVSAEQFARRLFLSKLNYPFGNRIGLPPEAFGTFVSDPEGAAVIDIGGDGTCDVQLDRVDDPADTGREGVVRASSDGVATDDYAISMRETKEVPINNIRSGDITFDYFGGAYNTTSAPDEVYLLIEESNETDRLVYHTGNDGDQDAEIWKTRDVGAEINGNENALNKNFNWFEVAPGNNTYSKPSNGGLNSDLDGTIKAVGFGRGSTGGGDTIETYYDKLVVDGAEYEFRPDSLHDIATRGIHDDLTGISPDNSNAFETQFQFDRFAGNDFQGDGVDISFTFALAQESGQDVL